MLETFVQSLQCPDSQPSRLTSVLAFDGKHYLAAFRRRPWHLRPTGCTISLPSQTAKSSLGYPACRSVSSNSKSQMLSFKHHLTSTFQLFPRSLAFTHLTRYQLSTLSELQQSLILIPTVSPHLRAVQRDQRPNPSYVSENALLIDDTISATVAARSV